MKNGMKQTEIGEIPVEWEVVQVGTVVNIETGKRNAQDSVEDGEYPFFTRAVTIPRINTYSYNTEALFIAGEGNFKLKYYEGKFDVHQRTYVLTNAKRKPVSLQFLKEVIDSKLEKLVSTSVGSTVQSLRKPIIAELTIPLPPLPEQQKIAEILSTLDEKMAVMDEQLAQTQQLKKGLMQHLLTKGIGHTQFKDSPLGEIPVSWEVSSLGSVFDFLNGRAFKPTEWTLVGVPIIRIQNLNGSSDFNYYDGPVDEKNKVPYLQLLFSWSGSRGTSFGPFIWKGSPGVLNQHIFKVHVKNMMKFDKDFGYFFLKHLTSDIEDRAHGGGGLVHITKKELEKFQLSLPPLPEQRQIAEILTTVDEKIGVLQDKKAQYQTLKRGLMQQLLTGQRRVRVPALETAALV